MHRRGWESYLEHIPLFRACSREELRRIGRLIERQTVDAGDVVVREGEVGHEMFVIASGEAVVTRGTRGVAALGPGDWFGELAVLRPAPRNATVTAATAMNVLVIPSSSLARLVGDTPAIARKLLVGLARRLYEYDHLAS